MNTTIRKIAVPASLLLMTAASALAQKQTPPEGAPAKAFAVPAHETYSLANGMKVTLIPYGIIPKVTLNISIDAGTIDEGRDHRGVADLTTSLMQEGTTTLTSAQLAEAAARMGSTLEVSDGYDQSTASLDVLSEFGPDAVKLLADVLEHPLLPASELERLKGNELRQLAVSSSRSQTVALERFRKLVYGDHPYSVVNPSEDDVKKIALADIKAYVAANVHPERAHLYVAGKFDSAAVKKAIASEFGGWAKGNTARAANPPAPQTSRVLDVSDRPGAPQSTLIIGLPVTAPNSPDAIPLNVANALLGGSFNSRITANIREAKGYTYSPFSQVSSRYHDSYWAESADVTTKFTGDSINQIVAEIKRLGAEPPTAQELKGIQNYLSGIFVIQNSSRSALIGQMRAVDFQGLGDKYLETYVSKVNALTPADIQKITAKYIRPEGLTIVVVGDKSKMSDQLGPYEAGKPL